MLNSFIPKAIVSKREIKINIIYSSVKGMIEKISKNLQKEKKDVLQFYNSIIINLFIDYFEKDIYDNTNSIILLFISNSSLYIKLISCKKKKKKNISNVFTFRYTKKANYQNYKEITKIIRALGIFVIFWLNRSALNSGRFVKII